MYTYRQLYNVATSKWGGGLDTLIRSCCFMFMFMFWCLVLVLVLVLVHVVMLLLSHVVTRWPR